MKVYYTADNSHWKVAALIMGYLDGDYPKEEGYELYVTDSSPKTTHIWPSMEFHGISVERVYEIDLPHSKAELAPYKSELHGTTRWSLPWYVVAGHPVKIMDSSIDRRTMGLPVAQQPSRNVVGRLLSKEYVSAE